ALVFMVMTTWKKGRAMLWNQIKGTIVPLEEFYRRMRDDHSRRVPGTAVFMTSNSEGTPPALVHNFLHNHVVHKQVVLLTVVTEEVPYVDNSSRVEVQDLGNGF